MLEAFAAVFLLIFAALFIVLLIALTVYSVEKSLYPSSYDWKVWVSPNTGIYYVKKMVFIFNIYASDNGKTYFRKKNVIKYCRMPSRAAACKLKESLSSDISFKEI